MVILKKCCAHGRRTCFWLTVMEFHMAGSSTQDLVQDQCVKGGSERCTNDSFEPVVDVEERQPDNNFLGIASDLSKDEQIQKKNSNIDRSGILHCLPLEIQESLADASLGAFVSWLDEHPALRKYPGSVSRGKAAIVKVFTAAESKAIIQCMSTQSGVAGVMSADETSRLYPGRLNTSRHLIADPQIAELVLHRIRHVQTADNKQMLPQMRWALQATDDQPAMQGTGSDVVAVGEKIRLVTTESGGGQGIHADISEKSDDGLRISVFTFQCYLNPESYEGGNFQMYPLDKSTGKVGSAVDITGMTQGSAVVFAQEDEELQHGGGVKSSGQAKRAIRGNLEAWLSPEKQHM